MIEIVLLLAGGVIAVLSFMIPAKKEPVAEGTKEMAKAEIQALVGKEMDGIRGHVDDVVDEAIGYAVEKTERSLERLTNEKIMAVNEYSDTVLQEIRKNHEETMFLYDMLNDKHANLKNTVSEVNRTVQEVTETKKEAEAMVNSFQQLMPERMAAEDKVLRMPERSAVPERHKAAEGLTALERLAGLERSAGRGKPAAAERREAPAAKKPPAEAPAMELNFMGEEAQSTGNSNEKILKLYRQGKSKIAIAKELGLGVGEVKLVIDLYKNL